MQETLECWAKFETPHRVTVFQHGKIMSPVPIFTYENICSMSTQQETYDMCMETQRCSSNAS